MSSLKVVVFLGSVRENRIGKRVADFVIKHLKETNHQVELLDPLELKLPLLQTPLQFYPDRAQAPQQIIDLNKKIEDADAFVVVAAEYNATLPPALTNMMDHFPPSSYAYRPSGIVTYSMGSFGGMRAAMTLRSFLTELQTSSIPSTFTVPTAHKTMNADGTAAEDQAERLNKNALKMINQLDWFAEAMKNQRQSKGLPQ